MGTSEVEARRSPWQQFEYASTPEEVAKWREHDDAEHRLARWAAAKDAWAEPTNGTYHCEFAEHNGQWYEIVIEHRAGPGFPDQDIPFHRVVEVQLLDLPVIAQ